MLQEQGHRVLSIDVGIKHLAFCVLEHDGQLRLPEEGEEREEREEREGEKGVRILAWNVIDITSDHCAAVPCDEPGCAQPAKYAAPHHHQSESTPEQPHPQQQHEHWCATHAKKKTRLVPKKQHLPGFVAKQTVAWLRAQAETLGLPCLPDAKKSALVQLVCAHYAAIYFAPLVSTPAIAADSVGLASLARHLVSHFGAAFGAYPHLDHVVIENQLGRLATRMKTTQGMLVQYFVMSSAPRVPAGAIHEVSPVHKLAQFGIPRGGTYALRKKTSVDKCRELLRSLATPSQVGFFDAHRKKDDLADAFLQGLWFVRREYEGGADTAAKGAAAKGTKRKSATAALNVGATATATATANPRKRAKRTAAVADS